MSKRSKRILISLAIVIVLIVGAFAMTSLSSRKPASFGVNRRRMKHIQRAFSE